MVSRPLLAAPEACSEYANAKDTSRRETSRGVGKRKSFFFFLFNIPSFESVRRCEMSVFLFYYYYFPPLLPSSSWLEASRAADRIPNGAVFGRIVHYIGCRRHYSCGMGRRVQTWGEGGVWDSATRRRQDPGGFHVAFESISSLFYMP